MAKKKKRNSQSILASAMREVHENIPSTVKRAHVKGARKEAMLRAIAFAKARRQGAHIPKVGGKFHFG